MPKKETAGTKGLNEDVQKSNSGPKKNRDLAYDHKPNRGSESKGGSSKKK